MRKYKFKHLVLTSIVTFFLACGIGVGAITLTAEQIKYSPSNENFDVTNTKDAIDELYLLSQKIGEGGI